MFMTTKERLRSALGCRWLTFHARIQNELKLGSWRRDQRIVLPMGRDLPVIFCTWRRIERLPRTLEQLAAQEVPVQACIWNNSPDRDGVDAAAAAAGIPVSVHHSPRNIGGFGRFYLARQAAEAGHSAVVFIDDDQDFWPQTIGDLLSAHRPRSLSGWWAFRFTGPSYGDRTRVAPGKVASYVGTCGMIADTSVFRESRLFRCPRRFWFVEDLWLCYVADLMGYDLFRSPAEFGSVEDEHALYLSLGRTKWNFLRYLMRHGWEPVRRDNDASRPADRPPSSASTAEASLER